MLTHRGWWFFLMVLAVLAVGLAAAAGTVTLIALTLLVWFLGQWLVFAVRTRHLRGSASVQRDLRDDHGPVKNIVGPLAHYRSCLLALRQDIVSIRQHD